VKGFVDHENIIDDNVKVRRISGTDQSYVRVWRGVDSGRSGFAA